MTEQHQLRFQGRRAVVVGVASHLGRACAVRLGSEGADLLLVDESVSDLSELQGHLGGRPHIAAAAADSESDIRAVADYCNKIWPSVDALVICTGILDNWSEQDDSYQAWEKLLRADLLAPIFYVKAFRPALCRSGQGSVVLYGSVDGLRGNTRLPAYSVARGGLVPFTHIAAELFGRDGVRVNYLAGAGISPDRRDAPPPPGRAMWDLDAAMRSTPLGRTARPEDVAGCVAFLASDDAAYVNGAVLTMDGGRTGITPGTAP
jgi:NAD(P)-dependent dehydrogenase (short-subunit alcohol dehydrogenase family)